VSPLYANCVWTAGRTHTYFSLSSYIIITYIILYIYIYIYIYCTCRLRNHAVRDQRQPQVKNILFAHRFFVHIHNTTLNYIVRINTINDFQINKNSTHTHTSNTYILYIAAENVRIIHYKVITIWRLFGILNHNSQLYDNNIIDDQWFAYYII